MILPYMYLQTKWKPHEYVDLGGQIIWAPWGEGNLFQSKTKICPPRCTYELWFYVYSSSIEWIFKPKTHIVWYNSLLPFIQFEAVSHLFAVHHFCFAELIKICIAHLCSKWSQTWPLKLDDDYILLPHSKGGTLLLVRL